MFGCAMSSLSVMVTPTMASSITTMRPFCTPKIESRKRVRNTTDVPLPRSTDSQAWHKSASSRSGPTACG